MSVKFDPTLSQMHSSRASSPSTSTGLIPGLSRMIETIKSISSRAEPSLNPSIQTVYDYMNGLVKSEKGHGASQMPAYRDFVKEAEVELIKEISAQFLRPQQKIVEIGAGRLDANGHSYFMQRLPQEVRSSVEPTEVNRALFDPSDKKLKHVDTLKLAEHYSAASLDRIIGSAVLETLSDADLMVTLQQAHAVLNKDGLLVHISSLEPFRNVLMSAHTNDHTIFFPSVDQYDDVKGLQVISKADFIKFLDTTKRISDHAVSFLRWYADLPAYPREIINNELIFGASDSNTGAALVSLSKWIAELNPEGLKYVENITFFEDRVKKTLKTAGFEILVFESRTKSHTIKRPRTGLPGESDYFSLDRGPCIVKSSSALKKTNRVYQSVKMHVIVAKKISKDQKV